jgi:SAM-dependent methyltransferase
MTTPNDRLERLKPLLTCPGCRGALDFAPEKIVCRDCHKEYRCSGGKIYFTEVPERSDEFDTIKGRLRKWLGKYYYSIGIGLFAPIYPFSYKRGVAPYFDSSRQIALNIGCGNIRLDPDIIGIDIFDYEATDIICDVGQLPFRPESVDVVLSLGVMEHLVDPIQAVREFTRCTRPGGLGLHVIPFLFPFHASPHDYQRYTHRGLEVLFRGWEVVRRTNVSGPVSLWLLSLVEFLSIVASFGNEKLQGYAYLFFCLFLFPFKYLDFFFVNRASFLAMAPTIFIAIRKPTAPVAVAAPA